ncbi:hypothetical protein ASG11_06925 [Sphingomonas sp. Leaf357]|uniref:hypothetical protein n=1 Tax=Sphingomonas sp. Leaf357 TaxID=1736350 RepID=UPI0006F2888C|nr:hypothetical protein [Sphingomonas sp. Leaf357]KQS04016.1 hypothetical protein ASG11_06925 [Sphingomonas sp. Leaf357]
MRFELAGIFLVGGLASGVWTVPAQAQSTGLEDMAGARAGQAEGELQRRGYRNVRGEKGDDRSYAYWWNADRRQCVTIATMNGRYSSITPTTPPDCRQSANLRPRPDYTVPDRPVSRPRPGYEPNPNFSRPPYPNADERPGYPGAGPVVGGRPVDLGLVCFGDGSKNGITSGTTWTWNADRDRYEHGRYNQSTTELFDASLMIQLWGDGGRIRLPKSLIPPINSRGNNGWWDLYAVRSGRDVITASYRLNGLNKPRITIDRRSGRITVQGTASYGFRGNCDLIGANDRRF